MFLSVGVSVVMTSQNLFPEGRQNQLHSKMCGFVLHVQDGIDFRDLEGNHLFRVRDHLHRQVSLAVVGAPSNGSSHSWRFIWIEEVRVKGYAETIGIFCNN